MATLYQRFGLKVRKLRKERKLTQEKLAEMAKIDPKSVIEIEAGKRNSKLKTLHDIARALKVSSSDLLPF